MNSIMDLDLLLIEDNRDDAELAIRALKRNNPTIKIKHLDDGEEALCIFQSEYKYEGKSIDSLPKLILLDLKLPKVDGFEILINIRNHPQLKMIPVVILSSSSEEKDIFKAYSLGANSYIVKPVDFELFMIALQSIGQFWITHNKIPEIVS
jgi:two-component system, response regulator